MFEFAKNLLRFREVRFEEDGVLLHGQPLALISMEMLMHIQKDLEKRGLENQVYHSVKEGGQEWMWHLEERHHMSLGEHIRWGCDLVTMAGYGRMTLTDADLEKKSVTFRLCNSALNKVYGESAHPIDHVVRAKTAGALSYLFGEDIGCVETKCKAMGEPYCEFVCKPKDEWDLKDEFVREQLKHV